MILWFNLNITNAVFVRVTERIMNNTEKTTRIADVEYNSFKWLW